LLAVVEVDVGRVDQVAADAVGEPGSVRGLLDPALGVALPETGRPKKIVGQMLKTEGLTGETT
jgi:hypothetical protein